MITPLLIALACCLFLAGCGASEYKERRWLERLYGKKCAEMEDMRATMTPEEKARLADHARLSNPAFAEWLEGK